MSSFQIENKSFPETYSDCSSPPPIHLKFSPFPNTLKSTPIFFFLSLESIQVRNKERKNEERKKKEKTE